MLVGKPPAGGGQERVFNLGALLPEEHGGRLLVGRDKRSHVCIDAAVRRLVSKQHGVFILESPSGAVRYADLDSLHGSVLLPGGGRPPRCLDPLVPVPLWPGDAVALGSVAPRAELLTRDFVYATMYVLELVAPWDMPPSAAPAPESARETPDPPECAVCQSVLCGARILPCGHAFCADCITHWFREAASCPSCRAPCGKDTVHTNGSPCVQLDELALALACPEDRERIIGYKKSMGGFRKRRCRGS